MVSESARGVLTQNSAVEDAGRFTHVRHRASPDLAPFVEHYWSVSWDLRGLEPQQIETLPHPSIHMVFDHSGTSRIAGIAKGKFVRMLEGQSGAFGVKFKPGGFFPFLLAPVSTLAGRTVPLGEVFGADGDALVVTMQAESDDAGRMRVAESFLRSREIAPDATVPWITELVYSVARDRAILRVEDLVSRYGVNKRTLQRLFAKYVGATPKWVIQRYRLHEAAAQLVSGDDVNHAMLAASLGYSDQAHFVRDFKAMVGVPPAAYSVASRADKP